MDNVIIGSDGATHEERVANHARALKATLDRLREHQLRVDPAKMRLFMEEIEFCGHVMRDGRRWPSPGKLQAIQKWSVPQTVSALHVFVGLTNYYSAYVPHYAQAAAPLTKKLKVKRKDGKKRSRKRVN